MLNLGKPITLRIIGYLEHEDVLSVSVTCTKLHRFGPPRFQDAQFRHLITHSRPIGCPRPHLVSTDDDNAVPEQLDWIYKITVWKRQGDHCYEFNSLQIHKAMREADVDAFVFLVNTIVSILLKYKEFYMLEQLSCMIDSSPDYIETNGCKTVADWARVMLGHSRHEDDTEKFQNWCRLQYEIMKLSGLTDINSKLSEGNRLVHFAWSDEDVEFLIEQDADWSVQNNAHQNAYEYLTTVDRTDTITPNATPETVQRIKGLCKHAEPTFKYQKC